MTLRLFEGDCLSVMKDLSANSIDCFVCDLPYGCLTPCKARGYLENKKSPYFNINWDTVPDLNAMWEEIKRLRKSPDTPILMFCNMRLAHQLIQSNQKEFQYEYVWDKGRVSCNMTCKIKPLRRTEYILVFSKKRPFYILKKLPDGKYPHSLLDIKHVAGCNKVHPTEKPIELYKWLIERYCPANGTILDPTAGSFNSCFAAQALGRNAIGIEKDPKFFKKAKDRVDGATTTDTIASGTADN